MSLLTETLCRTYAMHGVNIEVRADDHVVLRALELRLRSFVGEMNPGNPSLKIDFISTANAAPLRDIGRPVYETPYGCLRYLPDHDLLTGELGGVALHCEPTKRRALIAAPAFREQALYFATHPVTTVALMELMERLGRFSLHAGCLADADGNGLLLSGPSGAGKSTLTLALAQSGMEFLGDDIVFIGRPESDVTNPQTLCALGFADAVGISGFAATLFPERSYLFAEPPDDGFPKRLHRFEDLFGRKPVPSCKPRVIVFPEVTPGMPSSVTRLDRGEALLRLVPDVLVTHAPATQAHITMVAELLAQVRCYTARSGHDTERAAELIRALV